MKKLTFAILMLFFLTQARAYNWIPFGPDTINALHVGFEAGPTYGVICADGGLYVFDDNIQEWAYYSYGGLPVRGAVNLDPTTSLVAMGNMSWSDGIYTFNLLSHQFAVVEWVVDPSFLIYYDEIPAGETGNFTGEYFVGSRYNGLYTSADGYNWAEVPFFSGKTCRAMGCYQQHLVISGDADNEMYLSDDYGVSWSQAPLATPWISDMIFDNEGELYGIFPNSSNSSGLWHSVDFGSTWQVSFYSDHMSAVGYDAMGNLFVGWEAPFATYEGVAIYNPAAPPPGLTFLNEGLPNTCINKILLNPTMSVIAIFCCTGSGVYYCNDYFTSVNGQGKSTADLVIFPNPIAHDAAIRIVADDAHESSLVGSVYDAQGVRVHEVVCSRHASGEYRGILQKGDCLPGMYYFMVVTRHGIMCRKIILR
jgi:hypothetical protein